MDTFSCLPNNEVDLAQCSCHGEIFWVPKFFWGQKNFRPKNCFEPKLFRPKIVSAQKNYENYYLYNGLTLFIFLLNI